MDEAVAEVLKTIGWNSGFRLPIANEENQALERELAHLVIKKSALTKEYDDVTNRCKSITDHLKYVRKEVQENQTLYNTYHQQLNNENHKLKLKQAEKENIIAETRRMVKLREDIKGRLASKKLLLARNLSKLEKIKSEAEWDTQAMKAWEESVKKRDDDNELLKKFSEEDRKKFMDLETRRNSLQTELNCRKGMLAQMDVDVTNYEQVIMRSGKMMSIMKEEREGLVKQWQESVKTLRQKDLAIKKAHASIEDIRELLMNKREEMEEQEAFLSNEINSNKYIQVDIHEVNVQGLQMRKAYHQAIQQNLELMTAQVTRKKLIQKAAVDMTRAREQMKEASKNSHRCRTRLEQLNAEIAKLKSQKMQVMKQGDDATKNGDLLDSLIKDTEKIGAALNKKMQSLLTKQYKMNSTASDLKDVGNLQKVEMCALENALAQIRKRSATANQVLIHKKQCLSDLEMKIACIEAQMGNTDPDEMQDFEDLWGARIQELDEANAQLLEVKNLLHVQILSLQKENLRLVNAISNDAGTHQTLKDKLQTLCLQIEGGVKKSKTVTLRSQQLQVQENILRLKVDKLQSAVKNEDEEIYNMQRYNIDLETTLKERHVELTAARDLLFAKRKNLDEDRNRLKADIGQRCTKIKQLENKHNLALGMLGKDEDGEPISVTAFKLRAAQEKYELQEEGDDLEKKIKKAEQEIVAMENTLKLVNMTNKSFRDSLTIVDPESYDAQEIKDMQSAYTLKLGELKEKRHELYLQVDIQKQLKDELDQCLQVKTYTEDEVNKVEESLAQMDRELTDRKEKIARATRHLEICLKKLDKEKVEKYDRDLFIRQVQEINKNILYLLADFAATNPTIYPVISMKFERQGLEMPAQRTSLSSVSSESVNSATTLTLAGYSSCESNRSTPHSRRSEPERSSVRVTSLELSFGLPESSPQSRASTSSSNVRKETKPKRP